MSAGAAIPHLRGLEIARELLLLLASTYTRAAVAGSLRRGQALVGDVELVIAPAFERGVNLLDRRFEQLLGSHVEKRLNKNGHVMAWGRSGEPSRYKALVFQAVPVDVFIVLPDRQWGPTMVLRTGPGDANHVLVTPAGARTKDGLAGVLPRGLKFIDGGLWDLSRDSGVIATAEEADVFAACGLPWLPPPERSVEEYQRWAAWRASDPRAYERSWSRAGWSWRVSPGPGDVAVDAIHADGRVLRLAEQAAMQSRNALTATVNGGQSDAAPVPVQGTLFA